MMHQRLNLRLLTVLLVMSMSPACGMQKPLQHQAASDRAKTAQSSVSHLPTSQKPAAQKKAHQHLTTENMTPGFLYLAAQNALKDGNHALAIELLTALVKKDPDAVAPHIQLTRLLLASGQTAKAAEHINMLLASKKLSAAQREVLQLSSIRIEIAQGRLASALKALTGFLKTRPAHILGRDLQARILSGEKRYDEALAAIGEALRAKERPEFLQLQAQILIKSGDNRAARITLMRMRKIAPDDEDAVLLLSALNIQEKHMDKAEKLLRDFMGTHPQALRISLELGKLLIQSKRLFDAIIVYRDIAVRSGNNPDILRQLGMLYFQHKDYAEAEKTFRKLVDAHPDDMSRFYLAASMEAQDKVAEASTLYEKIDTGSALATEAQVRLAAIDVGHDQFDEAARRLKTVLKTKPGHMDAHLILSAIRLTQKKFQTLIDETADLMSRKKLPPQLLFNRAVAFEHFKQYEQSEVMLSRVIKLDPDYAEALNFLGYTYAVQGIKLDKAKVLIQRALIQKPGDGYYLDSLAWVYYRNGDYAKAASTQSKALKQVPDDAVMHEHYGDIMWKNGKQNVAKQAWQKAITLKSKHPQQLQQKIKSGLKTAE